MSLRRLVASLGLCVTFVAAAGLVTAAPKTTAKSKTPLAPAKGSGAGSATGGASGAGSGSGNGGGSGSAVQPIEEPPPKDMNGTDENPDAPKAIGVDSPTPEPTAPVAKKSVGYPFEEVLRPITLPENMSEISIGPHFQSSPYAGGDALHARYGITERVQLGLTYVFAAIYGDKQVGLPSQKYSIHSGKAFGVDVTVLLQNWIAIRVGVPFYVSPVAFGLQLGAPLKFTFGDKLAIGGLDDLLTFKLDKFAPSLYQELYNAEAAFQLNTNTPQSNGHFRISGYATYQESMKTAVTGRFGIDNDLGDSSGGGGAGTSSGGGTITFIRAGVDYTPRRYFDIGISIGFDDLSVLGSFGPQGYLALRI